MAVKAHVIRLTPIQDRFPGECPECGYESLVRVRLAHLTMQGVGIMADAILCGRCAAERKRHA